MSRFDLVSLEPPLRCGTVFPFDLVLLELPFETWTVSGPLQLVRLPKTQPLYFLDSA